MAVVVGGFGPHFNHYRQLSETRDWNTANYDYPVLLNKGETSQYALNEKTGKGMVVNINKYGYYNSTGGLVKDLKNPVYEVRDAEGKVNNDYYVDQNTGDVYFRPTLAGGRIRLPNHDYVNKTPNAGTVVINDTIAQYFGTTFTLDADSLPNPQDFGDAGSSNINFDIAFAAGTGYADVEVNGVKIASNDFNTGADETIPTSAASALYTFSNSFAAGADNFSPVTGSWHADETSQRYYNVDAATLAAPPGVASTGSRRTMYNGRSADNFILETKIRMDVFSVNPADWAGIHFRATKQTDDFVDSGYLVRYARNGNIELYKGGTGVVASTSDATFSTTATEHTLKINANGNNIQVSVNGTTILSYTDNDRPFTDGFLSFRTLNNIVSFDDFKVNSYTPTIQLLSRALKEGQNSIVVKAYGNSAARISVAGNIGNVDLSTNNLPPNLQTLNGGPLDITSFRYRNTDVNTIETHELDPDKAYWSVSTQSALGIIGKIDYKNREGGSLHKVRDEFSRVNTVMQNLTSIIGLTDDLFNSHLNVIR